MTKTKDTKSYIFDLVRRKHVMRTPEEDVRQLLLHHLIHDLKYPKTLIGVEKQIIVNGKRKRFDVVVFKESKPWMIIECKKEDKPLNDSSLMQLLSYNVVLKASYLVLFNGLSLRCYDTKKNLWYADLPMFYES